ncbi:MAG TPA: hypothetical protein VG452_13070 [Egibacteraceae bacterium]|nr:hypothetical protein [Egibacteraceae bacterium]
MVEGPGEPHDAELARLSRRLRAELRAEAEAYEQLAATDLLRGRRLADVAAELVSRGDVVALGFAPWTFTGTVIYAAGDLATLRVRGGEVDVNLGVPLYLRVVERVRAGGLDRGRGPQTFLARLAEHEAAGGAVELGSRALGEQLHGVLRAVARDHVVFVDRQAQTWYLATAAIDYVAVRR